MNESTIGCLAHVGACVVAVCVSSGVVLSAQQVASPQAPVPVPADVRPMSVTLEDVPYPYPVEFLRFVTNGQEVRMAYMDVPPLAGPNGRTAVLLHGMNFYGEYWSPTIEVLRQAGFRVVVPDQIGFGRSTKAVMPYTVSGMAANTKRLLDALGLEQVAVVGHSMGGVLATRFGLLYPEITDRLVLVNQIGVTDARLTGPPPSVDETYRGLLNLTYDRVYRGHARYFPNGFPPDFERYTKIQYGWSLSGNWPQAAMVRALVQAMIYHDPVVYDWPHIQAKTLELSGGEDGPEFAERARYICDTIPDCELRLFPGVGHVPQVEVPDQFHAALLDFLTK